MRSYDLNLKKSVEVREMDNIVMDVKEMLEQTVDAVIDNQIRDALEKEGDEFNIAVFDLLKEFGLSGRKSIEFIYKFSALSKMYGKD
jgi:hypothetical protein